jgi:hypothetical protein
LFYGCTCSLPIENPVTWCERYEIRDAQNGDDPMKPTGNILSQLCPPGWDSYELEQVLLGIYRSSSGDRSDPKALLFPGHHEQYAIKLVFDKKYELKEAFAGPLLTESDLAELQDRVEREVLVPGTPRIGNWLLFAAVPVTGFFRFRDDFQILPVPKNAPRPPFLMADHPFLLQFRFRGSENSMVERMRLYARASELELLLAALVANHIHSENQTAHRWVFQPMDDPPRAPRSILCQTGYTFEGHRLIQDEFTSAADDPPLTLLPLFRHYSQFGIRTDDVLVLPEDIEAAILAYEHLPTDLKMKFKNSSFWLQHSFTVFLDSRSASYMALVSAVEALMPPAETGGSCACCKRSMGKGPTSRFREFLAEFAPTGEHFRGELQRFYEIRSKLAHGGTVLLSDRHFGLGGLEDFEDWRRQNRLHEFVRVACVNWLFRAPSLVTTSERA